MNTRISSFRLSLGAIITSLILSTSLCKAQVRSTLFFDKDSVRHKAQVEEIIKKMTLREKVALPQRPEPAKTLSSEIMELATS